MKASTIFRKIIRFEEVKLKSLAEQMGYNSYTALQARLVPGNDLKTSMACDLADRLGYEIVVRKKGDRSIEFNMTDTDED